MMMGACTGRGMVIEMFGMRTPSITIGAILSLVFAKRKYSPFEEAQ